MPLAESTQAANLTFDAAVSRALARRVSDIPLHSPRPAAAQAPVAPAPAAAADGAGAQEPAPSP